MAYDPNSPLPNSQEGLLQSILQTLQQLLGNTSFPDAAKRTRVVVDAALPAGAAIIGALTANQSVNVGQINAVTPLMNAGVSGTGSLRVTPANDTVAGIANPAMIQQAWNNTPLFLLYSKIT